MCLRLERRKLHSFGRFGVGLSACLLYSLSKLSGSARIVTKQLHKEQSTVIDFVMGIHKKPMVSQEISVKIPNFVSGNTDCLSSQILHIAWFILPS